MATQSRRPAAELKQIIVEAGRKVLYRRGLRATASHVPMTEALEEVASTHGLSLSMGSVFGSGRLWPNVREFQLDVLESVLQDHVSGGPNDSSLALIHQLPPMDDDPLEDRMNMLIELCRIAGSMNGYVREPDKGRTWTLWVATWSLAVTDSESGGRLLPSLRDGEEQMLDQFSELYGVMLDKLGLRIRSPYRLEHLAMLAASLTDGIALRASVIPDRIASAPNARSEGEWNVLGVGLMAVALELIEDDHTQ